MSDCATQEDWLPTGYIPISTLVEEHGLSKVRDDLYTGRLKAFRWDRHIGSLQEIGAGFWGSIDGERWLAAGRSTRPSVFDGFLDHPPVELILVKVEDEPLPDGGYLPPYMVLMQRAIKEFKISEERWPKKEDLVKYFLAQKLPDGTPVSPTHANYLTTFVRPVAAMSGGNSKK